MKIRHFWIALFIAVISINASGQSKVFDDYVISDPQTWNFMKYRGAVPDLYTGTASAHIPVYTYSDPDFEIPVSLDYASNGYLPNVPANYVGLGWTLSAAGNITREVQGIKDNHEKQISFGSTGSYTVRGYSSYVNQSHDQGNLLSRPHMGVGSEYCFLLNGNPYETRSDIYSFHFFGYDGKFIINDDGTVSVYESNCPSGEVKVDLSDMSSGNSSSKITLKMGNGFVYEFSTYTSSTGEDVYHQIGEYSDHGSGSLGRNDIWYLSKITAVNGRIVTFLYDVSDSESMSPRGGRYAYSRGYTTSDPLNGFFLEDSSGYSEYYLVVTKRLPRLSLIRVDSDFEIRMTYQSRVPEKAVAFTQSPVELATAPRLSRIEAVDVTSGTDRRVLDCVLSHRYAPSTGSNPVMMLASVQVSGLGTYKMNYLKESEPFPYQGCVALDHWGYYNANTGTTISSMIPSITIGADYSETVNSTNREPSSAKAERGLLSKIEYPTGGWTEYEYEPHVYDKKIFRDETTQGRPVLRSLDAPVEAGGLRVKRIKDYTGDGQSSVREYEYVGGNMLAFPRYSHVVKTNATNSYTDKAEVNATTDAYNMDGTHIEYGSVIERFADGSCIKYDFMNYADTPDSFQIFGERSAAEALGFTAETYILPSSITAHNMFKDFESLSSQRGRLKMREYKSADGTVLKRDLFEYDSDSYGYTSYVGTTSDGVYINRVLVSYKEPLMEEECYVNSEGGEHVRTSYYTYNSLRQVATESVVDYDGTQHKELRYYLSDISGDSMNTTEQAMVDANIVADPIYEVSTCQQDGSSSPILVAAAHNVYGSFTSGGHTYLKLSQRKEADIAAGTVYAGSYSALTYRTLYTVNAYNSFGRPCTITDVGGVCSHLLWAYKGLYPIALVQNATTAQMSSVSVSPTTAYSFSGLSNTKESSVRNIPGASVTTWKYIPYIGVSAKTDSEGKTTTYNYDDNGRLVSVIRPDGNMATEYSYHTVTQ